MKKFVALVGLLSGVVAGILLLLHNPLSPRSLSSAGGSDSYQWQALEFFGSAFTPAELLGVPTDSVSRSFGTAELGLANASIILLQNAAGQPVALATRLGTMSKGADLLLGNIGVNTYTNIFWPNRGSLLMHGYENRWPLIRAQALGAVNPDLADGRAGQAVSAPRPDQAPVGIVGGSGQLSGMGGGYTESLQADPEKPGQFTGSISLEMFVK